MWRARQTTGFEPDLVDDPDVGWTDRRAGRHERQAPSIAAPRRNANAFRRERDRGALSGRKVHHLELVPAGDVPDKRRPLAIVAVRNLLELRVVSFGEHLDPARSVYRDACEYVPLAIRIRAAQHPAVAQTSIPELRLAVVRREARLHWRASVHEIDVAVAARDDAMQEHRVRVVVVNPRDPARSRDRLAPESGVEVNRESIPVGRIV